MRLLSVFLLGVVVFISACAKNVAKDEAAYEGKLLVEADYEINAIQGVNSGGDAYWLGASESSGISKITTDGKLETLYPGKYEFLDSVKVNDSDLIATVNAGSGQPQLFLNKHSPELQPVKFNIDGVCLYKNQINHIYLLLIDGYGGGELRWVYHGGDRNFIDIKVKNLTIPPGIEACVAEDNDIYFLEETLGVWQYPAEPETAAERELAVYSKNKGEVKGLVSVNHSLYISEQERSAISQYSPSNAESALQTFTLPEGSEPADLGLLIKEKANVLAYVDESTGAVYTLKVPKQSFEKKLLRKVYPEVSATAETFPVDRRGDAADDPAIWVNTSKPDESRVLGTNKKFGLLVYDLKGQQLQSLPVGNVNNVDLRQNVTINGKNWDIAVASNRSDNSLQIFSIDKNGSVSPEAKVSTGLDDVYGICLYYHKSEKLYALINDKDGRVKQYLIGAKQNSLTGTFVNAFSVKTQPEGCVSDDSKSQFFLGEEDVGIWHYTIDSKGLVIGESAKLIAQVGDVLVDDVEGLALYLRGAKRYLVVSSQGDNSYAVYDADAPFKYRGSFRVGLNSSLELDGTSETDGLDVSGSFFNQLYPDGMLVIQDGHNLMSEKPQNFKLIPWERVAKVLDI